MCETNFIYRIETNEKDFNAFCSLLTRDGSYASIMLHVVALIIAVTLMVYGTPFFLGAWSERHLDSMGFVGKNIILPIGVFMVGFGLTRLIARYLISASRITPVLQNGLFLRSKTFSIDVDGVREDTEVSSSRISWAGIIKISDEMHYYLFYVDNMSAYLIPKRVFSTLEEGDRFYKQALAYKDAYTKARQNNKNPWSKVAVSSDVAQTGS